MQTLEHLKTTAVSTLREIVRTGVNIRAQIGLGGGGSSCSQWILVLVGRLSMFNCIRSGLAQFIIGMEHATVLCKAFNLVADKTRRTELQDNLPHPPSLSAPGPCPSVFFLRNSSDFLY